MRTESPQLIKFLFLPSLWRRVLETGISRGAERRFLDSTRLYLLAVHQQVINRAEDNWIGIEEFLQLRRDTGALKVCRCCCPPISRN